VDFFVFVTNWGVQSVDLRVGLLSVGRGQFEGMGLSEPHEVNRDKCKSSSCGTCWLCSL